MLAYTHLTIAWPLIIIQPEPRSGDSFGSYVLVIQSKPYKLHISSSEKELDTATILTNDLDNVMSILLF